MHHFILQDQLYYKYCMSENIFIRLHKKQKASDLLASCVFWYDFETANTQLNVHDINTADTDILDVQCIDHTQPLCVELKWRHAGDHGKWSLLGSKVKTDSEDFKRNLLIYFQYKQDLPPVPPNIPKYAYGKVTMELVGTVTDQLDRVAARQPLVTVYPLNMEQSGFVSKLSLLSVTELFICQQFYCMASLVWHHL